VTSQSKTIPGLNIQWPWSRKILSGEKTVETRSYRLPDKYRNKELAVIETAGPRGRRLAGITEARVIGIVVFARSFKYTDRREWERDKKRHCVAEGDRLFRYQEGKDKWGWEISHVKPFESAQSAPSRKHRGIIFASKVVLQSTPAKSTSPFLEKFAKVSKKAPRHF
jgi:hypothetical protein